MSTKPISSTWGLVTKPFSLPDADFFGRSWDFSGDDVAVVDAVGVERRAGAGDAGVFGDGGVDDAEEGGGDGGGEENAVAPGGRKEGGVGAEGIGEGGEGGEEGEEGGEGAGEGGTVVCAEEFFEGRRHGVIFLVGFFGLL